MSPAQWLIKYKFHHILMWTMVMTFSFLTYYNPAISAFSQIANVVTVSAFQTIPFYLSAYVLVPRLLYRRRFVAFVASFFFLVISMGLITLFFTRVVDHITLHEKNIIPGWKTLGPYVNLFIWDTVISCFGASSLKILTDRFRMEKRLIEVEKEKINTELSFLRSQINPHFLFNVMNTIYFQIDKNNTDARVSVEKF